MNRLFELAYRLRYLAVLALSLVLGLGLAIPSLTSIAGTILVIAALIGLVFYLTFPRFFR